MTTATAATPDPAEDPKAQPSQTQRRPDPAKPPAPQPQPPPPPKPPQRPTKQAEGLPPEFEDDPPPEAPPAAPGVIDERLRAVGQRLQLLVTSAGSSIDEARAVAGVLRPDGSAYGRMEGLLQAMEYDREALGRAIEHLAQVAKALAAEQTQKAVP